MASKTQAINSTLSLKVLRDNMAEIKVYIPDEVNERFRKAAMFSFGYGKGALSNAAEQAFDAWAKNILVSRAFQQEIKDPVAEISGLMKSIKKNAVTLQHEASNIRAERYKKHRK
jgi:hypothetical protein